MFDTHFGYVQSCRYYVSLHTTPNLLKVHGMGCCLLQNFQIDCYNC